MPNSECLVLLPTRHSRNANKKNGNIHIANLETGKFTALKKNRIPFGTIAAGQFVDLLGESYFVTAGGDRWLRFWTGVEKMKPKLHAVFPISEIPLTDVAIKEFDGRFIVAAGDSKDHLGIFELLIDRNLDKKGLE